MQSKQVRPQSVTNSKSSNIVSKDDFFKMLVAQLKNQDPMKPLDATAFTAQLAQFSSLEKLENVNSTLTKLLGQQDSIQSNGVGSTCGQVCRGERKSG